MKKLQVWLFGLLAMCFALGANAASVLDTATLTAITSGFTDMKDTILGLLNVAWPFLIAVPILMMSPRIVSKMVKLIARG